MTKEVINYIESLKGKKVAFVGLGVANLPCALFLAKHGVSVYACDKNNKDYIGKEKCTELENLGVTFSLGENYLDILDDMDVIFRSNGILPFQNPWIMDEIKKGKIVTSEMEVFFNLCPAKIYAITGSNGKTTTTTLIAKMLKAAGKKVYIGGNIGKALMPELETITENDYAVCELSSFQLLTMGNLVNKPDVAVVTNIESTHLDHHISLDEYVDSKRNVLIYQNSEQRTVLNADCDYSIGNIIYHDMRFDVRGQLSQFSIKHKVDCGAYMNENGDIVYSDKNGNETVVMNKDDIAIPGSHNIENYCTAICAVWGEVSPNIIKEIAKTFGGVEHRIEYVRTFKGVKYYNDSIATSPSRVKSGICAFNQKVIIIQGGSDKGNDLSSMTDDIINNVKLVILNGATAERIKDAIMSNKNYKDGNPKIVMVKTLDEAVMKAKELAVSGDIVSLCPACPAFDQFKTFEYRGRHFKKLVNGFE